MIELTPQTVPAWLAAHGLAADPRAVRVRELPLGVSNRTLWADRPEGPLVVKQARAKLAVAMEWLADVRRIVREAISQSSSVKSRVDSVQHAQANGPRTIDTPKPMWRMLIITIASRLAQARASGVSTATGITASKTRVDRVRKMIIQLGR